MRGRGSKRQTRSKSKSTAASTSTTEPQPMQPSESQPSPPEIQQPSTSALPTSVVYSRFLTEPAQNKYRFRYLKECLARSAGTLPGATSTKSIKTYPTIEIGPHEGAVVVVSCITKDKPYRAHPHKLVSRNFCENGICKMVIEPAKRKISFNFGIQSATINEVLEYLELRETLKIDPFKQGFSHKENIADIDLKALRLCFQVYFKKGTKYVPLSSPLVSNIIFDSKTLHEFLIHEISHCSGPIEGGTKIILTCNKVTKEGLRVTFFTDKDGKEDWCSDAEITRLYKQVAITFYTPPYRHLNLRHNVTVYVQLRNNKEFSNALPFEYIAPTKGYYMDGKKRKKLASCSSSSEPCLENLDLLGEPSSSSNMFSPPGSTVNSSSQDYEGIPQTLLSSQQNIDTPILQPQSNLDQNSTWYGDNQLTCLVQLPQDTQHSQKTSSSLKSFFEQSQRNFSQVPSSYHQLQGISSQETIPYQQPQVISQQETLTYQQPQGISSQETIPYQQPQVISQQETLTYQQLQGISSQETIPYQQPQVISQQETLTYQQPQGISSQETIRYHQPQVISQQETSSYQQLQGMSSQETIPYQQPQVISQQETIPYQQPQVISQQETLSYQQPQGISSQETSRYQQPQVISSQETSSYQQPQGQSQMSFQFQQNQDSSQHLPSLSKFTPILQQLQHSLQSPSNYQQTHNALSQTPFSFQQPHSSTQSPCNFQQPHSSTQSPCNFQQPHSSTQSPCNFQQPHSSTQQPHSSTQSPCNFRQTHNSSQPPSNFQQPQVSTQLTPTLLDRSSPMTDFGDILNQITCNMVSPRSYYMFKHDEDFLDEMLKTVETPPPLLHKDGDVNTLTEQLEALHTSDLSSDNEDSEKDSDKSS